MVRASSERSAAPVTPFEVDARTAGVSIVGAQAELPALTG